MTQIQVDYQKSEEAKRHNKEMELLQSGELDVKSRQADAQAMQAEAAKRQAETAAMLGEKQKEKMTYEETALLGQTFANIGKGVTSAFTIGGLFA